MNKILLGKINNETVYLSKHSWDCNWYWGFGYLGNKNCHFHMESLIREEYDVTKIFTKTKITQKHWWVIRDLFTQAYALKAAAAVYSPRAPTTLIGITDCIKKEMEDKINADLEKLLDLIWNCLLENVNENILSER